MQFMLRLLLCYPSGTILARDSLAHLSTYFVFPPKDHRCYIHYNFSFYPRFRATIFRNTPPLFPDFSDIVFVRFGQSNPQRIG